MIKVQHFLTTNELDDIWAVIRLIHNPLWRLTSILRYSVVLLITMAFLFCFSKYSLERSPVHFNVWDVVCEIRVRSKFQMYNPMYTKKALWWGFSAHNLYPYHTHEDAVLCVTANEQCCSSQFILYNSVICVHLAFYVYCIAFSSSVL